MRTSIVLGLAAVLLAACGGGDGEEPPGRSATGQCYGDGTQACTGVEEYETCVIDACELNYEACLGRNFQDGEFGGVCQAYMLCIVECACEDTACSGACTASITEACTNCLTAELGACVDGSGCTAPNCDGMAGAPKCDELADCCPTLNEDQRPACTDSVAAMDNAGCDVTLQSYQSLDQCL